MARRKTDIVVNLHALCLQPASASLEMSKIDLNSYCDVMSRAGDAHTASRSLFKIPPVDIEYSTRVLG